MEKMGPFGSNNPHPLFFDSDLKLDNIKRLGQTLDILMVLYTKTNVSYNAVGFELADEIQEDYINKTYNIVYYPEKIIFKQ